jgi:hypothetical protein
VNLGANANAADTALLNIKQAGTSYNNGIYIERGGERNGYHMYIGGALDSLTFRRNYFGTQSDVMSLTRDGNVGIGTASPTTFSGNTVLAINNSAGGAVLELQSNATSAFRMACSSADAALWEPRNVPILIATNNTERMRLQANGVLKIGNGQTVDDGINPGYKNVAIAYNDSGNFGDIQAIQQNINVFTLRLNNSGGQVYAGASRLDNISDERMKTDIEPITNALEKVKQLSGKKFHLIDEEEGKIRYGFIAQDLEGILDDFVVNTSMTYKNEEKEIEIENIKSIESWASSWSALLVEAIKEQQEIINEMRAEIDSLKTK